MSRAAAEMEAMLLDLARHGKPSLCLFDDGWFCWLSFQDRSKGITIEVKAGFRHETPSLAVAEVVERLYALGSWQASPSDQPSLPVLP